MSEKEKKLKSGQRTLQSKISLFHLFIFEKLEEGQSRIHIAEFNPPRTPDPRQKNCKKIISFIFYADSKPGISDEKIKL